MTAMFDQSVSCVHIVSDNHPISVSMIDQRLDHAHTLGVRREIYFLVGLVVRHFYSKQIKFQVTVRIFREFENVLDGFHSSIQMRHDGLTEVGSMFSKNVDDLEDAILGAARMDDKGTVHCSLRFCSSLQCF